MNYCHLKATVSGFNESLSRFSPGVSVSAVPAVHFKYIISSVESQVCAMSLNSRAAEARFAVKAGLIKENGKAIITPSKSKPAGTYHQVFLSWQGKDLRATCAETNPLGQGHCLGNSNGVCWHVLAAVVHKSQKSGKSVSFCSDRAHADRLARVGGKVYRLFSGQGKGQCWMVIR